MRQLRAWWHTGEDGTVVVYRKGVTVLVIRMLLCLVALWVLVPATHRYLNALVPVAALGFLRGMAEARRAIIFTDTLLIYRPPFAAVHCIPLAEIAGLRRSFVAQSYGLRARWARGVQLTMTTGETIPLPLDTPKADEILQRLSAIIAKPIYCPQLSKAGLT
jgi:hypothetical protein